MPRGRKKTHKGGHRHFSNEDQMAADKQRLEKEKQWRRQKGIESSEDDEDDDNNEGGGAAASRRAPDPRNRDFPPSDSESEDSEDEESKTKGVSHLIEIENPNHVKQKMKKVSQLDGQIELSRREREEIEKQRAKEHYQRMHIAGKTEEARADLARLAIIRKQREEAQKKKDQETKAKELTKTQAEKKLLEKKQAYQK